MRLPSTRSLEAVLVVVWYGSLAAAAGELGMSVPALSRRIALLEADLGTRLFERIPSAVAGHVLLSPDHRPEFWHEWLRAHDIDVAIRRIRDVDALLLYELALTGPGVAIGIEPLATALLRSNRLCGLTEHQIRSERSFHFVTRRAPLSRAARLFREWMLSALPSQACP